MAVKIWANGKLRYVMIGESRLAAVMHLLTIFNITESYGDIL
jgi:hypothetical protein